MWATVRFSAAVTLREAACPASTKIDSPVCIISTAQQARPKVMGQMEPLRAHPTRSSTFEMTNSAVDGLASAAAALEAMLFRCLGPREPDEQAATCHVAIKLGMGEPAPIPLGLIFGQTAL